MPMRYTGERSRAMYLLYPAIVRRLPRLEQAVLLQFLSQGIAIDAQHFSRLRLVALGARHDGFQYRFFNGQDHHFVHVGRRLLPQILEIFFKAFPDDILNTFFAHGLRSMGLLLSGARSGGQFIFGKAVL
jgi:hypothetical protein